MWHFDPNRSFQSQLDPQLFNLILKIIKVAPKRFQRFLFCVWEIFFENFQRFSLKSSKIVNFWARKMFFFLKQVRISPEIDWYHYQSANAAPTAIVRHRIMTDPFWQSVTSEPTVPPPLPQYDWFQTFLKLRLFWCPLTRPESHPKLHICFGKG